MTSILDRVSLFEYGNTDGTRFLIYTDRFGRKWKLTEVTNEDIKFPFIITPLPNAP